LADPGRSIPELLPGTLFPAKSEVKLRSKNIC
jgi:hypothetical protein